MRGHRRISKTPRDQEGQRESEETNEPLMMNSGETTETVKEIKRTTESQDIYEDQSKRKKKRRQIYVSGGKKFEKATIWGTQDKSRSQMNRDSSFFFSSLALVFGNVFLSLSFFSSFSLSSSGCALPFRVG